MYRIGKNLLCLAMKGNIYAIEKIAKATPEDFNILNCRYLMHGNLHWRAEIATHSERVDAETFIHLCQIWLEQHDNLENFWGITPEKFFQKYGCILLARMV